ncbi:MAG: hypothetical protein COV67_08380 [Nitrospinae bacterium CG11_big_fil_rev_8_21_14_0_20_56_8]|nr:MAG: hypothetical protein COV67_08380 [Nitrospinae bacterium CG11_big_fil_rev_8_21_14_0_20_56_8]
MADNALQKITRMAGKTNGSPIRGRWLAGALTGWGFLSGCFGLGPETLQQERKSYNVAVQQTNDEQLLLNLVRLRYRDTPFFMEVSSVATQFSVSTDLSGTANLSPTSPATWNLKGGVGLIEKPTVTYSPLIGEQFIQRFLSPVPLETLALLYHSGWRVDRVFRLCLQRMNRLRNAPSATGPTPNKAPEYEGFKEAAQLLRHLQREDMLEVIHATHQDLPALLVQIAPEAQNGLEAQQLSGYLGTPPQTGNYIFSPNPLSNQPQHVRVETRSLMGIMFFLSQGVEIAEEDQKAGKVTVTRDESGNIFDWKKVTGDLLRVRTSPVNPSSAAVSVRYRGHWFYIDDSDLNSKSSFTLLSQLFSLQSGKLNMQSPLLTLPVGN